MYELLQAGPNTYYIDCPAKIGLWRRSDADVYLIDSGNDRDAGRKLRQILDVNGWRLKGILNTHSNADHVGGNSYLQGKTGCPVFGSDAEAAFTRHPLLEPSLIYGGYPFGDLRNKFLVADKSDARELSDPLFPREIEIIPLPGHFIDMVGYRTPDGVVFLADSLCSEPALAKYGVTFLYDVGQHLQTLDRIEAMEAALFVPAHADTSADVRALVRMNRTKVLEIADRLLALCETPMIFENILRKIFIHYRLTMNAAQYVLVGSTIRSYLSWLKDTGRMTVSYEDNYMTWKRI